jgi:hypothetical protein
MSSKRTVLNSPDLAALCAEGFNIEILGANLVVWEIPYVTKDRTISRGALVTPLDLNGDVTAAPKDHQIKFVGAHPCSSDGAEIEPLRHSAGEFKITDTLVAQHNFSNKPSRGHFLDFREKITHYADLISGPAQQIDPDATPRTRRVVEPQDEKSPFRYLDTNSGRAEINMVTAKLAVEHIAIVGLGGTGSYILDFMAKTPAQFIHLFDSDVFSSHNAFRAPGAAPIECLRKQMLKVEYFASIYSNMHTGIVAHPYDMDEQHVEELRSMACVFLCMDASPKKKAVVERLEAFGITFIDVGMGLYAKNDMLGGTLQAITSTPENREQARSQMSFNSGDVDNEYDKNIQVADLNCMNALLAVIRWKKLRGFYMDLKRERSSSFTVGSNLLINEDEEEED